jgi:hypothetical protein
MDEIFYCPYCGQENSLFVDPSAGSRQRLIVDCETCCRPILVDLKLAGGDVLSIEASPENE